MADATLILGLAGIAGTVAAGGIAQLTTWRIERRRERRERRRETVDVLRAVRLIDEELARNLRALAQVATIKAWWIGEAGPRLETWEEHAPTIAGELSPANWSTLTSAASKVGRILEIRANLDADGRPCSELPWTYTIEAHFESAIKAIKTARILLRPVILGGSTLSQHVTGTWFPQVPELAPSEGAETCPRLAAATQAPPKSPAPR